MAVFTHEHPPFHDGLRLNREEFIRRWEMYPKIRKAELLGGVVHLELRVKADHGQMHAHVGGWLCYYSAYTEGCAGSNRPTTYLLDDIAQPDCVLFVRPEYGGATWVNQGGFLEGSPELLAEISLSSDSLDLHEKKDLYEAAGVQEYIAVLLEEQEIRWHRLVNGSYGLLHPDPDGIFRSRIYPGLWLAGAALLEDHPREVLETLKRGLSSNEHQAFVAELKSRKQSPKS